MHRATFLIRGCKSDHRCCGWLWNDIHKIRVGYVRFSVWCSNWFLPMGRVMPIQEGNFQFNGIIVTAQYCNRSIGQFCDYASPHLCSELWHYNVSRKLATLWSRYYNFVLPPSSQPNLFPGLLAVSRSGSSLIVNDVKFWSIHSVFAWRRSGLPSPENGGFWVKISTSRVMSSTLFSHFRLLLIPKKVRTILYICELLLRLSILLWRREKRNHWIIEELRPRCEHRELL